MNTIMRGLQAGMMLADHCPRKWYVCRAARVHAARKLPSWQSYVSGERQGIFQFCSSYGLDIGNQIVLSQWLQFLLASRTKLEHYRNTNGD
jgi:hypothetical protein